MSQPAASSAPDKVTIGMIAADPAVRVAFLVIFVAMLGFGIVAPILPLYARSFGVSYETASWMISAFAFARLLTDPVAGPLVERFGERLVSMAGVVIVGVSAFLTALAPSFAVAVLLRAAGGVGIVAAVHRGLQLSAEGGAVRAHGTDLQPVLRVGQRGRDRRGAPSAGSSRTGGAWPRR